MGYREIEIPRSGTPVFIPAKYYEDKLTPDADTEVTTIIINPNTNLLQQIINTLWCSTIQYRYAYSS